MEGRQDRGRNHQDRVGSLLVGRTAEYTGDVRILYALSDLGGVVAGTHVSPIPLLAGCSLLTVAVLLTRRLAYRLAHRNANVVDAGDLRREVALIGLVITMLAAIALIAGSVFDYR